MQCHYALTKNPSDAAQKHNPWTLSTLPDHVLVSFTSKYRSRPMPYSERVCQLCGVSFNIGTIRKPGTAGSIEQHGSLFAPKTSPN
jgi:hypothetical protein